MKKAIPIFVILSGLGIYTYFFHILPGRVFDPTVRGTGTIEVKEILVSSKIPARIASISVNEGDLVQKGDVLVVLECSDMEARLRQAEAQVASARAAVLQAQATFEQARAGRNQAKSRVSPFEVARKQAEREYARAQKLVDMQSAPEKLVDDAESAVLTTKEQVQAAQKGVQVAAKQVEVAAQSVEMARAQVELAERGADVARIALEECRMTAPTRGVVTRRNFEPGELVMTGSPVLRLAQMDNAYTWIYVSNEEVGKVRLGGRVLLRADTYPDRIFEGRVVRINDTAEFTPKSVQTKDDRTRLVYGVKVDVQNGDGVLLSGMPVEAELVDAAKKNHVTDLGRVQQQSSRELE